MIYSKTLEEYDYGLMTEPEHIDNVAGILSDVPHRLEHPHRRWEYGIVLRALRQNATITVLDVGGGGSIFAPAAGMLGMEPIQVDPEPYGEWALQQAKKLRMPLPYIQTDFFGFTTRRMFDAVVSISTLEHVGNDELFFAKMLSYVKPGGLLAMTVDFYPTGEALMYPEHLRTYNKERLMELRNQAYDFRFFGDEYDYTYRGANVNNYTFASMVLCRYD